MMAAHDISRAPRAGLSSLQQKARNIEAAGYALIPMGSNGNPQPYAKGQKYPASMVSRDAERFGVRLDGAILLDYDGNKASPMPISELFELLMGEPITEQEALSEAVQWRFKGGDLDGSYHWLFRLPEGVDASSLRQCVTGVFEGVDIKTGNQLIFIKADKDLADNTLPPISELLEAPTALLELLKQTAPVRTEFAPFAPTGETTRYGAAALAGALEAVANAPQGHRNETLNTEGLKVAQLVAGGEIAAQDAAELERAALAAGMGQSEITATLASATAAGMARPRNRSALPKKVSPLKAIAPAYYDKAATKSKESCHFTDWSNGERPKALNTNTNLADLLAHCGMNLRQNLMNLTLEMLDDNGNVTSADWNCARSDLISAAAINGLPKAAIDDHATNVASRSSYHPVKQWLDDGAGWDGVKRMDMVIDCIPSADPAFTRMVMKKWLVSCVAALYEKSFSTKLTPILKGAQSYRKTTFIRRLASVVDGSYLEGLLLDPSSKDSISAAIKAWVCELGEIVQTTKRGNDGLKAFLTQNVDTIRLPYDRSETRKPRQTLFVGTVNDSQFLKDDTGSTRFAVIEMTGPADLEKVNQILGWSWSNGRTRQDRPDALRQFWLEVKALYDNGAGWALTDNEQTQASAVNDQFVEKSPQYMRIFEEHITKPHSGKRWVAASELATLHGDPVGMGTRWGKALKLLAEEGQIESRKGRANRTEYLLPMPKRPVMDD